MLLLSYVNFLNINVLFFSCSLFFTKMFGSLLIGCRFFSCKFLCCTFFLILLQFFQSPPMEFLCRTTDGERSTGDGS